MKLARWYIDECWKMYSIVHLKCSDGNSDGIIYLFYTHTVLWFSPCITSREYPVVLKKGLLLDLFNYEQISKGGEKASEVGEILQR